MSIAVRAWRQSDQAVKRGAVAIAPVAPLRDKHAADRFCPVGRIAMIFGRSIA
jgi:hypothetical protein